MGEAAAASLRRHWIWTAAYAVVAAAALARTLVDLSGSPPGLYIDEASIGYNAWTIAHFGVDEHGIHLPLFFEAFGEYKNPVYVYTLSALLRVLPLTPTVERLPAAILGAATVLFLTLTAWRLSGSRSMTLAILGLAALTPWLTQESRVGFETISSVALLSAALWCLAGTGPPSPRRFSAGGVLLAVCIYGYSTARLEVLLFAVAFLIVYARARPRGWWRTLVPVGAGYALLGFWGLLNPGALTARYSVISVGADGASLGVQAGRFLVNYVTYFAPGFLFESGDANPRQNTGFAGMLLWFTAPLLIAGVWACWKRRREAFVRWLVLCILLAPVAAALTNQGVPHALRSSDMLPLLLVVALLGADRLRLALSSRRRAGLAVAGVLAAGLLAQAIPYNVDLFASFPARNALYFDTGVLPAITSAHALAAGHTVYLSSNLEQPYIEAFFGLTPPPPGAPLVDDATPGLQSLGMRMEDPHDAELSGAPGDLLVLGPFDPAPDRASRLIDVELGPQDPLHLGASQVVLASVYRLGR